MTTKKRPTGVFIERPSKHDPVELWTEQDLKHRQRLAVEHQKYGTDRAIGMIRRGVERYFRARGYTVTIQKSR